MRFLRCLSLFILAGVVSCAPPPAKIPGPAPLPRLGGVTHGQVEVSGEVVLAGDLRIPAGSSLSFAPGTLVWVLPSESTKIEPEYLSSLTEILVAGSLRVQGNSANPVRFLPLDSPDPVTPGTPLWAGIEVVSGGRASLTGTDLRRADVGLLVQQAEASLAGARFTDCRHGLVLQDGARVSARNLAVGGGEVGLFCSGPGVLSLAESSFHDLEEEGLYLGRQCTVRLRDVVSHGNDIGLASAEEFLPGLLLEGNRRDRLLLGGGRQ